MKRVLVAGVGNIFRGDDAFGVEVVRELGRRSFSPELTVVDFGIRSYDLAYALVDGYESVILVDATPRGQSAGTVYLIEPDLANLGPLQNGAVDAHTMNPVAVLQMARSLGTLPARLYLIGCEPCDLGSEEGRLGLSVPVREAVPKAIEKIERLVESLLGSERTTNIGLAPV